MKTVMIALSLMSLILTACASGPAYKSDDEMQRMHMMHERMLEFGRHERN